MLNTDLMFNIAEVLFLVPLVYALNQYIFRRLKKRHSFFSISLMNKLFFYHLFFGAVYYSYVFFNPSDSRRYFRVPQKEGAQWLDFLSPGTGFIDFISYPFINYLGFSYEMMMLLFTWIGFFAFVYAYLFFKENIALNIKVFKRIDLLTLILFLPNMHFWSASLGKGAPILLGIMMFAYALKKPQNRTICLALGSLLVFSIRPHMLLLLATGLFLGVMTTQGQIPWRKKLLILGAITGGLFLLQEQILSVVNLNNSGNLMGDFLEFTNRRAEDLSTAGSGIAMTEYSLGEKFFTFWFRPLFFDAPGILGIIVSIENFIYLLLFAKLLRPSFLKYLRLAPVNVKTSLALFLITSFAMTFIMSNLGIIIRQKTMIMYFLFFVIYHFLAHQESLTLKLQPEKGQFQRGKAA